MEKQQNFTDIEYTDRRHGTKREAFLEKMDAILPWWEWATLATPYYPEGKRGRKPAEIEQMLRMTMLQVWFSLSDEGIEDAIYDSYAMKSFMGIDFSAGEQTPDATTLCKFRKLLNEHGLQKKFFEQVQELLAKGRSSGIRGCTRSKRTPHGTSGCAHVGVDPVHGFVHTVVSTAANEVERKVAHRLLRLEDAEVY